MVVAQSSITIQTSSGWILPVTFNSLSHLGTQRAGMSLDSLPYKRQGSTPPPTPHRLTADLASPALPGAAV